MRFRIVDLIILTTIVALLSAVFRMDLQFFRQLLCFVLIALFATAAALTTYRQPVVTQLKIGAIGGLAGGIVYAVVTYWQVETIYPFDEIQVVRQSLVQDIQYYAWFSELLLALVSAILVGSAIGPLLVLRLHNMDLQPEISRSIRFSAILLLGALLLALFSMFDRLNLFGDSRDWSPLIFSVLVVFVIYTNSWLLGIDRKPVRTESDSLEG